jgi:dTDP-3-amino-3,4,6-trideoxy-alpha-D-glucose transaminase
VRIPFLDLAAQTDSVARVVAEVVSEGRYVGGPRVAAFEEEFARYLGDDVEVVGVASGTDAIELALRGLGVGAGDEVITVANTCVPTVAGIEAAGATAVLVDPDPHTATLDPAQLETALTPHTRAVMPVHLYGRPADLASIAEFTREHGLLLVEDAAQAHGATSSGGRRIGSIGDAAAFSFYPTKNLGALGDAGAVATTRPEVAERVRMLRSYGERDRYLSEITGRNSRLDAVQAAVLSARLPHLDTGNARRRELARLYRRELDGAAVTLLADDDGHVYHLFVVRAERRDALREALAGEGIETLVHYPRGVHEHPAYAGLGHDRLSASEALSASVLSLPLHPELADEDVRTVADAIRRLA